MVTALEILCELNNVSPSGVEYPGTYGNGLVTAVKNIFNNNGQSVSAQEFIKLIK